MRDLALVGVILLALFLGFRKPFTGVIVWTWFSVAIPQEEAWSFSRSLRLNLIIAAGTIAALLFSRERKLPPSHFLVWTALLFLVWSGINGFQAYDPSRSWAHWDLVWKIFLLGFLVAALATNRVRIHVLVCTIVLSLLYYGVRGGIFTIVTGGEWHVFGPPNSIIEDNNQLAVALLMALPLANYVRLQSTNQFVVWSVWIGMGLTLAAVLGSYSRGAYLALGTLAVLGLAHSRHKFLYTSAAAVAVALVVVSMPQAFWDRLSSIQTASEDASFEGRLNAWHVAWYYARDHFPFGAGLYGPELPGIFNHYFPHAEVHAAHSIFFQVLGENGVPGLVLYLAVLAGGFVACSRIIRRTRLDPDLEWCLHLARMIRLALIVFCVGGSALSMAYYDVFIVCVLLLVPMDEIASRAAIPEPQFARATPAHAVPA